MVKFTNITWDENFIYADVEDIYNKVKGRVKVHRTEKSFEFTDCEHTSDMEYAMWGIQRELRKKGTVQDNFTVCWT